MSYKVRPGGLLRCCLATLDGHMQTASAEPEPGEKLSCGYCKSGMVVAEDGAWEWDQK